MNHETPIVNDQKNPKSVLDIMEAVVYITY